MEKKLVLIINNKIMIEFDDFIQIMSFNIANWLDNIFIIFFLLILIVIITIIFFKYSFKFGKYFILTISLIFCIIIVFYFKGVKTKENLDKGEEIVKFINQYNLDNNQYPYNIKKLYEANINKVDSNFLNCCVEYNTYDYVYVEVRDENGIHFEKRPERSFSLIIWIENFPRYFVYNFSRKKFLMTEIQFSKD